MKRVDGGGVKYGESPRSGVVFWDAELGGYVRLDTPGAEFDATVLLAQGDALELPECDATELAEVPDVCEREPFLRVLVMARRPEPAVAPLLKLGQAPPGPAFRVIDLHVDHLGSTRLTTDEYGDMIARHDYLPFGQEIQNIVPSPDATTKKFTGHERDDKTGLDYMMARYYGAGLSRFISADPLNSSARPDEPETWNRYSYARNRPLILVDPTGMSDEDARQALASLLDSDVTRAMGEAWDKSGAADPSALKTREASGGIGEVSPGDFVAFSYIDPSATPTSTVVPTGAEIAQQTGGAPRAAFHTHQLTGRAFAAGDPLAKHAHPYPKGDDLTAAEERPQFVISHDQLRLAWKTDAGGIRTALVATFKNPEALKQGNITIKTPKGL